MQDEETCKGINKIYLSRDLFIFKTVMIKKKKRHNKQLSWNAV